MISTWSIGLGIDNSICYCSWKGPYACQEAPDCERKLLMGWVWVGFSNTRRLSCTTWQIESVSKFGRSSGARQWKVNTWEAVKLSTYLKMSYLSLCTVILTSPFIILFAGKKHTGNFELKVNVKLNSSSKSLTMCNPKVKVWMRWLVSFSTCHRIGQAPLVNDSTTCTSLWPHTFFFPSLCETYR